MRACMFTNGRAWFGASVLDSKRQRTPRLYTRCRWGVHSPSLYSTRLQTRVCTRRRCVPSKQQPVANICDAATLLALVFHAGLQVPCFPRARALSLSLSLGMTASPILISLCLVSRTRHFFNQIESLKIQYTTDLNNPLIRTNPYRGISQF